MLGAAVGHDVLLYRGVAVDLPVKPEHLNGDLGKALGKLAAENLQVQSEKYKPSLDLFGSLALNGRDEGVSPAMRESFQTDHNTSVIGLRITAQLLENATLSFDLAQARYNSGVSSIVELNQAQLNKISSEITHANTKYEYLLQRAILNFQIGAELKPFENSKRQHSSLKQSR